MWTLLLQSAVLLLAAYFIGVWLGCILRRSLQPRRDVSAGQPASATTVVKAPAVAMPGSSSVIAVDPDAASQPMRTQAPAADPAAIAVASAAAAAVISTAAHPAASPENVSEAPDKSGMVSVASQMQSITSSRERPASPSELPQSKSPPLKRSVLDPADNGVLRLPLAAGSDGSAVVAAEIEKPLDVREMPIRPDAQDLTAIRGLDAATASVLEREGVYRYEQIVAWNEGDVARINRALGGMRRIQQENWIEQAKILMTGQSTAYLRAKALNKISEPILPSVNIPVATSPVSNVADTAPSGPFQPEPVTDELALIRGIDEDAQAKLASLGVTRFAEIANWRSEDVKRVNAALASPRRVQQENWIEQAALLSTGRQSRFARSGGSSSYDLATPTDVERPTPDGRLPPNQTQPSPAVNSVTTSAAGALIDVVGDDLTRIDGINTELERALKARGISRFNHIARLDGGAVGRLNQLLGVSRRIERENWIGQARSILGLDSVSGSVSSIGALNPASSTIDHADDPRRIRGVGALLERKLNAMGYSSYAQVANWTAADIDRISQQLDFRGRIERENWVEQARILSSGGQTEFSRRTDRGTIT